MLNATVACYENKSSGSGSPFKANKNLVPASGGYSCAQSNRLKVLQSEVPLTFLLPNHFARILVFPKSDKDRLAETVIPRPLREFYLADDYRFDPVTTFHFGSSQTLVPTAPARCRKVIKGTLFNPDFFQFRKETA